MAKSAAERASAAQRRRLWTLFRITPEELRLIEKFQKNHSIFKLLMGKHMGLDHCHKTGLIRGRLDFRLNRAYGLIEAACPNNTSAVLRALADFHDSPPAITALGKQIFGLLGRAQHKKKMVYGPPIVVKEKKKKNVTVK